MGDSLFLLIGKVGQLFLGKKTLPAADMQSDVNYAKKKYIARVNETHYWYFV